MPVAAAPLGREVEQVPERPHHVDVARFLAALGGSEEQLGGPEVAGPPAPRPGGGGPSVGPERSRPCAQPRRRAKAAMRRIGDAATTTRLIRSRAWTAVASS